jgi:Xaa-Pro dipeptidase
VPIVAFGDHTLEPHHVPTHRLLARGDVVLIDIYGEAAAHYCAEHTDTFVFQGDDGTVRARLDAVERAMVAATDAVGRRESLRKVEQLVSEVLSMAGLGDEYPGACGHDVGLSEHDPTDKDRPLAPGRVVAVEPSVYSTAARVGVRFERILT